MTKAPKKKKYLSLPPEYKKQITKELGCSMDTVDNALNYHTEGEQPELIRKKAQDMGAVEAIKTVWVTVY